MNKKLEAKNFELNKVKVNSKRGLSIEFYDLTQKNDVYSVESDSVPHDDFFDKLDELKEVLAKSLGLLSGWDFARENNRKNDEKLKEAIVYYNEEIQRCNVTGISLVGQGDLEGVKISGSIQCELGTVGLASPTIKFNEEEVGIGEMAKRIIDELQVEVWMFIYKGKRSDDLFNQKDEQKVDGLNTNEFSLKAV